jgi:beta-lactam-binding protein with PASTA domain
MKKYWEEIRLFFKRYIFIKTTTRKDLFIHLGLIISLTTFLIVFFFYTYLPATTYHRETVTVPNLAGMSVEEAQKFLSNRDLEFIIADSSYSKSHKPYTVLTQSPEPGARVKRNRKIRLTINPKTPPKVRVPFLKDMPFTDAERLLKNANLEVGRIKYKPYVGQNQVLEQFFKGKMITKEDIATGLLVPVGSAIDLEVGDGLGPTEFNMPDLIGLSQEEAELVLKGSDLVLGTVNYDFRSRRELGTVVNQNPKPFIGRLAQGVRAGSVADDRERYKVRAGDIVDIWVAGNPAARPLREGEEEEEDAATRRLKDSMERNVNERDIEHYNQYLKKRKGLDKKDQPTPKPKETKPNNQ